MEHLKPGRQRFAPGVLRAKTVKRTVTLPTGERALLTFDDSGHVTHIESAERLDCVASPSTIRLKMPEGRVLKLKAGFTR